MKNKLIKELVFLILFSLVLSGCGVKEKGDGVFEADNGQKTEKKVKTTKRSKAEKEKTSKVSKALRERAKAEGVSVSEMERMVEELTKMTAKAYGDTVEGYKAKLLDEGRTPFDEFAIAADYMEITIKEYYEYEKKKPEMSEEDKEIMKGMNEAVKELKGSDLSERENQVEKLEENSNAMEEAGSREINGEVLEIINYEVLEVNYEEYDSSSKIYVIEYTSKKEMTDIVEHFKRYLESTEGYVIMDNSPESAMINGTVNGNMFDVLLQRGAKSGVNTVLVTYYGEFEKNR